MTKRKRRFSISPQTLAVASSRHPWRTIGLWFVLVVTMGMLSSRLLADVLNQEFAFTSKPESVEAQDIIDKKFTQGEKAASTEFFIVKSEKITVSHPQFKNFVTGLKERIAQIGTDALAAPPMTYYDLQQKSPEQAAALVSADRHTTLVPVSLKENKAEIIEDLREIVAEYQDQGFVVQVAGVGTLNADFTTIAEEDVQKSESLGIMIALVVLVIVFGSIVAAVLPVVMAIFAIMVALGGVSLVGQAFDFNLFVVNMVTMIGLAVGIDYSLFIVSRYREERKKGFDKLGAINASGATANRAVFFSGLTVVLALLGMLIIPVNIFRSLAGGAILVTLAALAASMTLLPAILALLGDKINWPRLSKRAHIETTHDPKGGFWDKLTRRIMASPVVFLAISLLILGGLAFSYFDLNRGTSQTVTQLSDDFPSKQGFITLSQEFPGGVTQPARIIISGNIKDDRVQAGIKKVQEHVTSSDQFSDKVNIIPSGDGTATELDVYLEGDPSANSAVASITELRSVAQASFGGAPVYVGGDTAFFADFLDVASKYQWVVLAFVLGLSMILLTVVFRSVVLPVKAIIMNLLSVGAAYGAITLVFQKGWGIDLFNSLGFKFQQVGAIEAWLPLFLFSVLFGLSMDYHVFLLSRIREEFDKTQDNTEAVAYGLRTTAGIITGAALIMVAVFTGFAAGRLGPLQQMGFGLAVAVLIDATIVRTLLVPSSMRLLGNWNWYLPKWLEWLPQVHVEGHEPKLRPKNAK